MPGELTSVLLLRGHIQREVLHLTFIMGFVDNCIVFLDFKTPFFLIQNSRESQLVVS